MVFLCVEKNVGRELVPIITRKLTNASTFSQNSQLPIASETGFHGPATADTLTANNHKEPALRTKGSLLILLTVSLGTAWAMASKEQEDASGDVVGAVTKEARTHSSSEGAEHPSEMHFDLAAIKRPVPKAVRTTGLFDSKSWYAPPPVQAAPVPAFVPPLQPTAPSLPFAFIGRMVDGSEVTVFLSHNDRRYAVKEKDVLDDTYRVDKIGEADMLLTHLPTSTQQTLSFNTTPAANALISASELKAVMHPDNSQQPYSN